MKKGRGDTGSEFEHCPNSRRSAPSSSWSACVRGLIQVVVRARFRVIRGRVKESSALFRVIRGRVSLVAYRRGPLFVTAECTALPTYVRT